MNGRKSPATKYGNGMNCSTAPDEEEDGNGSLTTGMVLDEFVSDAAIPKSSSALPRKDERNA